MGVAFPFHITPSTVRVMAGVFNTFRYHWLSPPGNGAQSLGACPPKQQGGPPRQPKRPRIPGERRMASSLHPTGGGIHMSTSRAAPGHYLIASDFDQTLSFNDSGLVLSELI